MLPRNALAAAALALFFALAAPVGATPVLDQAAWPQSTSVWIDNDAGIAQTFTVGLTGQLVAIDLWVVKGSGTPAFLNLTSSAFGSVSIEAFGGATPPGMVTVDLTSLGLQVMAGDVVSFDLEHDDVLGLGATTGAYAAGSLTWSCFDGCMNHGGGQLPDILPGPPDFFVEIALDPIDIAFRTYVPEPSVGVLGILGLALALGRRRSPLLGRRR